jgi:hypothetical protein
MASTPASSAAPSRKAGRMSNGRIISAQSNPARTWILRYSGAQPNSCLHTISSECLRFLRLRAGVLTRPPNLVPAVFSAITLAHDPLRDGLRGPGGGVASEQDHIG